jgi:peroxiredoxin
MPSKEKAVRKDISGRWKIKFEGEEDFFLAASFRQDGERLTANIRSTIGDLRYLEGVYRNGLMLLSCFNGTWAFIFKAEMDESGVLDGIWARGPREPYKWTATKEDFELPDPFSLTKLTNEEGLLRFKYPLAENPERMISNSDPEYQGKPLLVAFTMTGCPNSHDNAELLSQMYKEFQKKGLNILAINFELITDVAQIQARAKRFREEHNLPVPVLYSFAMSKAEIGEEIPDFERFLSWPTVAFYGPDGKVDCIHTGMDGPGTGQYYEKLVNEYRNRIEKLLSQM